MYTAKVTEIGPLVESFLDENMLVLFGPTAPAELRDICAVHDAAPTEESPLVKGGRLRIDDQEYEIVDFGEAANTNLAGLGHIAIVFDGAGELLPGSVIVSPSNRPVVTVGSQISFCS